MFLVYTQKCIKYIRWKSISFHHIVFQPEQYLIISIEELSKKEFSWGKTRSDIS